MDALAHIQEDELERFFTGDVEASGFVLGRKGAITRRFTATFIGGHDDRRFRIAEALRFDDGEEKRKVWLLDRSGAHGYLGTSDGVDGAVRIAVRPDGGWRWSYDMPVRVAGRSVLVHCEDLMVPVEDDTVLAHTAVSKFGLVVARIETVYRRRLRAAA